MRQKRKRRNLKRRFKEINKTTINDIGVKKIEEIKVEETNGIMLYK